MLLKASEKLNFKDRLEDGLFSDVQLIFGSGSGSSSRRFLSHRLVLGSCSSFLKCILTNLDNWAHGDEKVTIVIPDFEADSWQIIANHLYGLEDVNNLDNDLVKTLRIGQNSDNDVKPEPRLVDDSAAGAADFQPLIEADYDENDDDDQEEEQKSGWITFIDGESEAVNDNWECIKCGQEMTQNDYFTRHYHMCVKQATLKVASKTSKVVPMGRKTQYVKTATGLTQCVKCGEAKKTKADFKNHSLVCGSVQKRHACPRCPKSFHYERHLRNHIESHDEPAKPVKVSKRAKKTTFLCDKCDTVCKTRSSMWYHMQKHKKPDHPCPKCPKVFESKSGLNYHLKIHSGVCDFLCDDCGEGFVNQYRLVHHRRSKHTFEKPYICEECGEGFIRNDKLKIHKRRAHTGEKPYPCGVCDWRGVESASLIHHRKKHNHYLTEAGEQHVNISKSFLDSLQQYQF